MIPPAIKTRFVAWSDCVCWCLCNENKAPINRWTGNLLSWKTQPGDSVNTLSVINDSWKDMRHCGYGIIVGRENTLACFDFDGALAPDGSTINPAVSEFLGVLSTFVEVSTSGKGLHAFVNLAEPHAEYGFDKTFCGGKFYPARFIKLTGTVYGEYDLPIRTLSEHDSRIIQNKIGVAPVNLPTPSNRSAYTGRSRDWSDVLTDAGILHITAPQYVGSPRQHGTVSRTCIAAWKIQCPNKSAHTDHHRKNDFSADAALLLQWDDGTSSCTCNHNSCNPVLKPNLLRKLWVQVHKAREEQARMRLQKIGVVL